MTVYELLNKEDWTTYNLIIRTSPTDFIVYQSYSQIKNDCELLNCDVISWKKKHDDFEIILYK